MLKKRERRTAISGKSYPLYSLEQAIDYVISAKKSRRSKREDFEGLR